jgi:hypothetical protein
MTRAMGAPVALAAITVNQGFQKFAVPGTDAAAIVDFHRGDEIGETAADRWKLQVRPKSKTCAGRMSFGRRSL